MAFDWATFAQSTLVGLIGLVLVVTACAESFMHGQIDPELTILVTAVVATYFTGTAVRQVNGTKVESLTQSVNAIHQRLDQASVAPANDGPTATGS